MNNNDMRHHHRPDDFTTTLSVLWKKICDNFATNAEVCKLARDMQKLEYAQDTNSSNVATTAAALVLKEVRKDLDRVREELSDKIDHSGSMMIEICTIADKFNRPAIKEPNFNTIYLTPAEKQQDDNRWDEWIAIPRTVGKYMTFSWEHLGSKHIDLSWVKQDFDVVNKAIEKLNHRLEKYSKTLADTILEKSIKPLNELKDYINSPEFISYVFKELPRASLGSDGLMTANATALLQGLALWVGNNCNVIGGGAMDANTVIRTMEYYGLDCSDIKEKDSCGHDPLYPQYIFPK